MPAAPLPPNEAERLAALRSYEVLDTAGEQSFDTIAWLAARLTGSAIALVSLVDQDRQWFKARFGLDAAEVPREQAFCAHAILDPKQPLVVPDATQDPRFADNPLVLGDPHIRFYAGVPLVDAEGHALGALCIIDRTPRRVEPHDLEALAGLAQSVMTSLEMRRALGRVQRAALTSGVTTLPDRSRLRTALTAAVTAQQQRLEPFGLLCVGLDGTRRVGSSLGSAIAEHAIEIASDALNASVENALATARTGDETFAAVLPEGDAAALATIAGRTRAAIEAGLHDSGLLVLASVGAVSFATAPADASAALAAAEAALAAARNDAHDRVVCRVVGQAP